MLDVQADVSLQVSRICPVRQRHGTSILVRHQQPDRRRFMSTASPTVVAFSRDVVTPHVDGFSFVTISTEGVHPGYARLLEEERELTYDDLLCGEYFRCGPAFRRPGNTIINRDLQIVPSTADGDRSSPTRSDRKYFEDYLLRVVLMLTSMEVDEVHAIRCPVWPSQASEWLARSRRFDWPASSVVDEVLGIGCHLVFVPHKRSESGNKEFRFSFSKAEVILINSWSRSQQFVYHVLRLIKKSVYQALDSSTGINNTILCTYHFKTLMLWSCEERPPEFWNYDRLTTSIQELLCRMMEWMVEKTCPNYFMPQNQMMDHIADDDQMEKELNLIAYFSDKNVLTSFIKNIPKAEDVDMTFRFIVPTYLLWAATLFPIAVFLQPTEKINFLNMIAAEAEDSHFRQPLIDFYCGLNYQRRCKRMEDRNSREDIRELIRRLESHIQKATQYFVNLHASSTLKTTAVDIALSDSLFRTLRQIYSEYKTDHLERRNSLLGKANDDKRYRTEWKHGHTSKNTTESFPNNVIEFDFKQLKSDFIVRKVRPLFKLPHVYLANFYYSYVHDYQKAIDTLVLSKSQMKSYVVDWSLEPIVLSCKWVSLFDDEIRAIFGFLALSGCLADPHTTVVTLCPVHFVRYVEVRCLMKSGGVLAGCKTTASWESFRGASKCRLYSNHEILEFSLRVARLTEIH